MKIGLVIVEQSVLSHLQVHQSSPFIKVKNQSHSLDFSLAGMMNSGILMYQTNCNTHNLWVTRKKLNAMQKSSNWSVDVKIVQIKSLLESSFSHFFYFALWKQPEMYNPNYNVQTGPVLLESRHVMKIPYYLTIHRWYS